MSPQQPVRSTLAPLEMLAKSAGFAVDLGGSLAKVAYISKEEGDTVLKRKASEMGKVLLASFPHSNVDGLVAFIKQECYVRRNGANDVPVVCTTGVRVHRLQKELESALNVRLVNVMELKWSSRVLTYLCENLPVDEVFHLPLPLDKQYNLNHYGKTVESFSRFCNHRLENHKDKLDKVLSELEDEGGAQHQKQDNFRGIRNPETMFPCLLVIVGSSTGFLQVEKDGSFELLDGIGRGGVSLWGQGSLLCDETEFPKLIEAAATGDSYNVDQGRLDFIPKSPSTGSDDLYSGVAKAKDGNELAFCFGKAPGKTKEDFQAGDLAKALLVAHTMELSQTAVFIALSAGLNRIYFCGSLVDNEPVRELMTTWCYKKKCISLGFTGEGEELEVAFIKEGPYLGALGALLASVDQPELAS